MRPIMFFSISLYTALSIFVLGLLWKISTWFRYCVGPGAREIKTSKRLFAAVKGNILTILSPKILTLLKVFVLDVLFQRRIFVESRLRWAMHMCIYGGFMLLLLMHALESIISLTLFPDYASTLNPFLFLRTLFGLIVMVGLGISFYRRHILKIPRLISNAMDHYMVIILAIIMISGFLLEGTKIVSYTRYQEMVEDWSDVDDEESFKALESYWVEKFGVVSPDLKGPFDAETLALGKELHEMNCEACHSRPQWAFISYGVAKIVSPLAVSLDKADVPTILWSLHFLACFVGLAYLPFSRMFHIIAGPLSLLANAVMDRERSDPANIATRQVMEMDACTHCGTCSLQCSVGVIFEQMQNVNILPSEKMASVKRFTADRIAKEGDIKRIQEGLYLCTNCYKCTLVCPVGINLQDLWFNMRETFIQDGHPEVYTLSTLSFYRGLRKDELDDRDYEKPLQQASQAMAEEYGLFDSQDTPIDLGSLDKSFEKDLRASVQGSSFSFCFTCTTCTSACPVACNYDNPPDALGLTPHQIMRATAMGLPDLIFRSKMLWTCLGCYQCQEACPQGVRVTDILYALKNMAIRRVKENT
jgi:heterodisulfide reductase subunit C/nitrate reductase gamma subunit